MTASETAVLVALHRFLDRDGKMGCLNPLIGEAAIDEVVAERKGSWGAVSETGKVNEAEADAVSNAYNALAKRGPIRRSRGILTRLDVPGDIALDVKCWAKLDRPIISGKWAFATRSSATAGHLYALRQDDKKWRVVAHQFTSIS